MKKSIAKLFISVSGLIVIDKILGFIRQMIVASSFGATMETDIINLSQSAVTDIQYILAQTLITSFVSIYIYLQSEEHESENRSKFFAGDSIKVFIAISFLLTCLLYVSSTLISKILAPSYSEKFSFELAKHIRIYSVLIVLFALICIFRAILSANKNFIPEQLISFNQSVITIGIVLIIGNNYGPKILIIAFFCYTFWNTFFLGFLCRKHIRFGLDSPWKNVEVKQLFRTMGPLLLSHSLIYVNQMVDRMLVSGLEAGTITSLIYGATLSNLITAFITAFCSMIFSYITSEISKHNYVIASNIANTSTKILMIIFMPVTITFITCAYDIVSIIYGYGVFDNNAVLSASFALKGYAVMFVPMVIREIFSRFQYAFKDTKRPMINGSIGIIGNVIFSIIFCNFLGVSGVALATSLSILISAVLNMISAKKKTSFLSFLQLKRFFVRFFLISVCAVIIMMCVYDNMLEINKLLRIIIVFAGCMLFYGIAFGKEIVIILKNMKNH